MTSEGALEHVLGNVLGYPDDHPVRLAFSYFQVHDINAFTMFEDDDFTLPYMIPDPEEDETGLVETRLVHVHAKRLNAVIKWYYQQPVRNLQVWFTLSADSFQTWYDNMRSEELQPDIPDPTPPEVTLTAPPKTFRSNIKITIADYPKLKEDKHWRTYNRLLKATAAKVTSDKY